MEYLYETHLHTCRGSKCAVSNGKEQARLYHKLGYDGILVTDHFFGGNTAVPRDLSWKERVDLYCAGYQEAWKEGQKLGLKVFFGWEQNYDWDEYLIYGLPPEYLADHPAIEHWNRREQLAHIHEAGGAVIQAHPFRDRYYVTRVLLARLFCDGIEAVNAGNNGVNDAYAVRYAREYGLLMTAGSDNHDAEKARADLKRRIAGIAYEKPLESERDYAGRLLRGEAPRLVFDPAHLEVAPEDRYAIPSWWLDENERAVPTNRDWLAEQPDFRL